MNSLKKIYYSFIFYFNEIKKKKDVEKLIKKNEREVEYYIPFIVSLNSVIFVFTDCISCIFSSSKEVRISSSEVVG